MSLNCVPPARVEVSPVVSYQNGAGELLNVTSSNELLRHEVLSGDDASVRPLNKRQVALLENNEAASAEEARTQIAVKKATRAARCWVMKGL